LTEEVEQVTSPLTAEIEPVQSPLTPEIEEIDTVTKRKERPLACPSGGRILDAATVWQNTCDVLTDPTVILKESEDFNW